MATITDINKLESTGFLILQSDSIHIPGDQRSIDAPGHGYPSHYENVMRVEYFYGKDELDARVAQLASYNGFRTKIRVFAITEMTINVNVKVGVV